MKRIIYVMILALFLTGCTVDVFNDISINDIDSKYNFENYEAFKAIQKSAEEDADYKVVEKTLTSKDLSLDIYLDLVFEDVEVMTVDSEEINLKYFLIYHPSVTDKGPDFKLSTEDEFSFEVDWNSFQGKARGMLVIEIPEDYKQAIEINGVSGGMAIRKLSVKKLDVDVVSGDIDIEDISAETMKLDSVSGEVNVKNSTSVKAVMDTTSGDVDLDKVVIDDARISTTSGRITVSGQIDDCDIDSVSGNCKMAVEALKGDYDIKTVSGSVELSFNEEPDSVIHFDSVSGDFDTTYTISDLTLSDKHEFEGKTGKGKHRIKVDTVSGDFNME